SRSLKETGNKIRKKRDDLTKQYGRSATVYEIADALDITTEEIVHAEEAGRSLHSMHETVVENDGDATALLDQIAEEDSKWFEKMTLEEAIRDLSKRERLIVYLRYYKDFTQSEVAHRLNISQVQVSRLEKKILEEMKARMDQT